VKPCTYLQHDITLVLDNAMLYNPAGHEFHKLAKKIKTSIQPFLLKLDETVAQSGIPVAEDETSGVAAKEAVGDLEPSIFALEAMLLSSETTEEKDNLTSIFTFELSKPRPPTPPPPPPPPTKEKPPKLTTEQIRQKREARDAAARERLVARPTRSAVAANTAFAQEAGFVTSDNEAHSRQTSGESRTTRRGRPSRLNPSSGDLTEPPTPAEGSSSFRPQSRQQRGVVGVEVFAVISDKDRRAQEKTLDLVTERVDDKTQFTRFNVGWVLPEGSKRKRAERPDTLGVPRGQYFQLLQDWC
jgi:NuA3 HAT complex component NTO1